MAELHVARRPALERPVLDRRIPRLERRRSGRLAGRGLPGEGVGRAEVRRDRPGGVLRLPDDSAAGAARGGATRGGSTGRRRSSTTRGPRGWSAMPFSCSASSRTSAGGRSRGLIVDFAKELGVELMVTLGALLADVPHTRDAPVTGSATDQGPHRAARPPGVALRGADRNRRRRPRRLQAREHPVGEPLGRRPALRLAGAESEGGGCAVQPARPTCSAPTSTPPSSTRRRRPTSARSARRSRPTRRPLRTSRSSSGAPTRSTSPTSRRASRWRRSSPASCGSATSKAAAGRPQPTSRAPGGPALAEREGVGRDAG